MALIRARRLRRRLELESPVLLESLLTSAPFTNRRLQDAPSEAFGTVRLRHSMLVSAAFSTIDWYKNKKFFYPLQVSVSYSHPFAGLNAPAGDLVAGELVVFF